jgi:integrase
VYNLGLDEFFAWYGQEPRPGFTKATVAAWRVALEARAVSIDVRITAVRKLAVEAADNGLLAPELANGITRVKGVASKGVRLGNWLTAKQAQGLPNAPDASTNKGLRDRAILAVLLGCGLRRSEVVRLPSSSFSSGTAAEASWIGSGSTGARAPVGEGGDRCVGCGRQQRRRPGFPIREPWRRNSGHGPLREGGLAARPALCGGGRHGGNRPHDCRRTCAKLCRAAGGELEQIQMLLAHASVPSTERYFSTKQDLVHAPNCGINLKGGDVAPLFPKMRGGQNWIEADSSTRSKA